MPARPKPFFDTNILVYCFDADSPAKLTRSRSLLTQACIERYGAVSYGSLILAAAQQADCGVIYTEDLPHGLQLGSLLVENPFRS